MERTPETDPALRTGGTEPAWTQLPQLNGAVRRGCIKSVHACIIMARQLRLQNYVGHYLATLVGNMVAIDP